MRTAAPIASARALPSSSSEMSSRTIPSTPAYPAASVGRAPGERTRTAIPSASSICAAAAPGGPTTTICGARSTRTVAPSWSFCLRVSRPLATLTEYSYEPLRSGALTAKRKGLSPTPRFTSWCPITSPSRRTVSRAGATTVLRTVVSIESGSPAWSAVGTCRRVTAASVGWAVSGTVSTTMSRRRAAAASAVGSPAVWRPSERRTTRPPRGVRASASCSAASRFVSRPVRLPPRRLSSGPVRVPVIRRRRRTGPRGSPRHSRRWSPAIPAPLPPEAGPMLSERSRTSVVGGGVEPTAGSKRATATSTIEAAWRPIAIRRRPRPTAVGFAPPGVASPRRSGRPGPRSAPTATSRCGRRLRSGRAR